MIGKNVVKKRSFSLPFIAFVQALALVIYCFGVGFLMWRGEKWAGPPYSFLGPTLFLVLFVASALISSLLVLGHPFHLFWIQKKPAEGLRLVCLTTGWLVFFVVLFFFLLVVF